MAEWDRLEGEPTLWFSRFERFRAMGPARTLLGCLHGEEAEKGSRKRSSKVPGAWDDTVRRWRWRERAEAWDAEQQRLDREREQAFRAERQKAWLEQSQTLQTIGTAAMLLIAKNAARMEAMKDADVLKYLTEGVKLERLVLGEATERVETDHRGSVDVNLNDPATVRDRFAQVLGRFGLPDIAASLVPPGSNGEAGGRNGDGA